MTKRKAIPLKGGQFTTDVRLDRVRQVDLRSLLYSVRDLFTSEQHDRPRSFTWRLDSYLDQGQEGACVGFGFTHEAIARPVVVKNVDGAYARTQVYWEAQKIDEWAGGAYPGATPFYEGTSVLAGAKRMQQLGLIKEYRWALSLDDLVISVGYHGPAVIGVDWYEGMYDTDADGYIRPTGNISGGHCLAIIGVRVVKGSDGKPDPLRSYFLLHNSWGPDWGMKGRAKMSFVDMAKLWPSGDFCIPVKR